MKRGRRDLLLGAGCVAALGTAEFLRPRTPLLRKAPDVGLTDILPGRVARWSSEEGGDIVIPRTPGSLADRLYSDQVARTYHTADRSAAPVMLLAAYGNTQSDTLQLHRPEVCYPAIGMQVMTRSLAVIDLSGAMLPVVRLTAGAAGRTEDIVYWTRLGDDLPQTSGAQRSARLALSLRGFVADGILVRASALREEAGDVPQFAALFAFLRALVLATRPDARPALIGAPLSDELGRGPAKT